MRAPEYHEELQRAYGLLRKLYQQGEGQVWTHVIEFLEGMESLTEEERRKRAADEAWLRRELDSLELGANIRCGFAGENPEYKSPGEQGGGSAVREPSHDELPDIAAGLAQVRTPEGLTARLRRALRFLVTIKRRRGRQVR